MKLTTLAAAWLAGMALAHGWYDADPLPLLFLSGFAATAALVCRLLGILRLAGPFGGGVPAGPVAVRSGAGRAAAPAVRLRREHPGPGPHCQRSGSHRNPRQVHPAAYRYCRSKGRWNARLAAPRCPVAGLRPSASGTGVGKGAAIFSVRGRRGSDGNPATTRTDREVDYPAYLESQGIYAVFWAQSAVVSDTGAGEKVSIAGRNVVFDLRRAMGRSLEQSLPPTEAALARALLLGLRGQLPDTVVENFRQSGTSHLLAISGLHLGILLLMTVGVLHWALGRHTPIPVLLALVAVWLYVLVSGRRFRWCGQP